MRIILRIVVILNCVLAYPADTTTQKEAFILYLENTDDLWIDSSKVHEYEKNYRAIRQIPHFLVDIKPVLNWERSKVVARVTLDSLLSPAQNKYQADSILATISDKYSVNVDSTHVGKASLSYYLSISPSLNAKNFGTLISNTGAFESVLPSADHPLEIVTHKRGLLVETQTDTVNFIYWSYSILKQEKSFVVVSVVDDQAAISSKHEANWTMKDKLKYKWWNIKGWFRHF